MFKIGMGVYQEPAMRMELHCTECGQSLSREGGSTEEGILKTESLCRKDPPETQSATCSKCGRITVREVKG